MRAFEILWTHEIHVADVEARTEDHPSERGSSGLGAVQILGTGGGVDPEEFRHKEPALAEMQRSAENCPSPAFTPPPPLPHLLSSL